ncbi:hypothetical protein Avbf_00686 [Armadillidium vulgare]|nr:hypothetical protein Avbf_00686 [Armadillidium vulgare]
MFCEHNYINALPTELHKIVDDVVVWMDAVDEALKEISKEATSAAEYERLKDKFITLCDNLDNRRDSMKWLVQVLDSLIPHIPEEDGQYEQNKLESLISRYKALVPSIETGCIQAESHCKCYFYRQDMEMVIDTLKTIKNRTDKDTYTENLEVLMQCIKEQEEFVKQLEEERVDIFASIQRGKDLSKEANAPSFIKSIVQSLETQWNECYNSCVEKFNKLKNMHKIWVEYNSHKHAILNLLSQAENELNKPIEKTNSDIIASELSNKQEMFEQLNEATDLRLRKLKNLSITLGKYNKSEKKEILEKEVEEMEQNMQSVIKTVNERIQYLNELNGRWRNYTVTLEEVKNWSVSAQNILERLVTLDMSPKERASKTDNLIENLNIKMASIKTLESEICELMEENISSDTVLFSEELDKVKEGLTQLQFHSNKHAQYVQQELKHWNEYQNGVQNLRPWIEEAERKVSLGISKPATYEEALQVSKTAQNFEKECNENLEKLHSVVSKSAQVARIYSVKDEVDALHSRWTTIHNVALQWSEKTENLVTEWEDFNYSCDAVTSWIHDLEDRLLTVTEHSPTVLKLEDRAVNLKTMEKELEEKQTNIINISAVADHISTGIGPEGVASIKRNVNELKDMIASLTTKVRKLKLEFSEIIVASQEFNADVEKVNNWLNRFSSNLDELDDIDITELESIPNLIHKLQQDLNEKRSDINELEKDFKSVSEKCNGKDMEELYEKFKDIEARYESYGGILNSKKAAIVKWKDFWEWQANFENNLNSMKQQLKANPNLEETEQLNAEILNLQEQYQNWKTEESYISQLCSENSLVIRDTDTDRPLNIFSRFKEMKMLLHDLSTNIDCRQKYLLEQNMQWESFNTIKNELNEFLEIIMSKVSLRDNLDASLSDIEKMLEIIELSLEEIQSENSLMEKLRTYGRFSYV